MRVMTFRLPEEDAKGVEHNAQKNEVSPSAYIRGLVQDGLMMEKRREAAGAITEVAPPPERTPWWKKFRGK